MLRWYFRISFSATVPGRYRRLLSGAPSSLSSPRLAPCPPPNEAEKIVSIVFSNRLGKHVPRAPSAPFDFLAAFPPVDFLAVAGALALLAGGGSSRPLVALRFFAMPVPTDFAAVWAISWDGIVVASWSVVDCSRAEVLKGTWWLVA